MLVDLSSDFSASPNSRSSWLFSGLVISPSSPNSKGEGTRSYFSRSSVARPLSLATSTDLSVMFMALMTVITVFLGLSLMDFMVFKFSLCIVSFSLTVFQLFFLYGKSGVCSVLFLMRSEHRV